MQKIKCPHCGKSIDNRIFQTHLARQKAKTMTPDQRRKHGQKMALARWGKKKPPK